MLTHRRNLGVLLNSKRLHSDHLTFFFFSANKQFSSLMKSRKLILFGFAQLNIKVCNSCNNSSKEKLILASADLSLDYIQVLYFDFVQR